MSNLSTLADTYAALDAQIKELKAQQDAIRKLILETKENVIHGEKAIVKVLESYPTTFSKDLAETLLSPVDFLRCHAKAIKPTIRLTVTATAKALT
jgi:hypothetical protein